MIPDRLVEKSFEARQFKKRNKGESRKTSLYRIEEIDRNRKKFMEDMKRLARD